VSIYTKTGDTGKTKLQNGGPIPKHHPIIQAMAALDELNAHLGIIKSQYTADTTGDYENIQKTVMSILTLISTAEKSSKSSITDMSELFKDDISTLESKIDAINTMLPPITSFVTYGATPQSAALDLARAVARRAETNLSQIAETSNYVKATLAYINRLSDFLYIKARYVDFEHAVTQAVKDALSSAAAKDALSSASVDASSNLQYENELTLTQAKTILEKIERKAKERNLAIVAACVNAAGSPIAVHVMDGALLISYEAALAKAYTATALKMPTADLHRLVQPGQQFYGLEAVGGGKILTIGGGVPLFSREGCLVGAIGVSGGSAEEDHELAAIACRIT